MERPWLHQYPQGVHHSFEPLALHLNDLLNQSFERYPDQVALSSFGEKITFRTLEQKVNAFASQLQVQGMRSQDHLGLLMPNCFQYVIAMLAGIRCGLVIVNINPLASVRECTYEFEDARLKGIVCFDGAAQRVMKALKSYPVPLVIVTGLGDELPSIKKVVLHTLLKLKRQVPSWSILGALRWRDMMKQGEHAKPSPIKIKPSDLAFLQYTGGTTGEPKAAMLSHANLVANISQCVAWVDPCLEKGVEKVLVALPLYHIFSLTVCFWTFLATGGESILIANPRDTTRLIKTIKSQQPSVWVGVNTLFHAMMQQRSFQQLDFSHVKLAIAGGMALHESVAKRWQQLTGKLILEGYGLSETSPVLTVNPTHLKSHNGSIGLPVPGTDIAIMDADGKALPFDEVGEICARGPQVMTSYWQRKNMDVFFDGGWFRTGDLGMMNAQGYVTLVDRQKDMILVSGFNVYPNEVEGVLTQHASIIEAGVVGIPCEASGEEVLAFIVVADDVSDRHLQKHCQEHLSRYKVPHRFERIEVLPKTPVGKVLRKALRAQAFDLES